MPSGKEPKKRRKPPSTWKGIEAKVAAWFGSDRTPLSGGNSKITRSDTRHPNLFIEVKYRQRHAIEALYTGTRELAKKENKIPVVVPVSKNSRHRLIILDVRDLQFVASLLQLPIVSEPAQEPKKKAKLRRPLIKVRGLK